MVLTSDYLSTYKFNQKKRTERIILQDCFTIKSADEELKILNSFHLDLKGQRFYFRADDMETAVKWIKSIGKTMMRPEALLRQSEAEALDRM